MEKPLGYNPMRWDCEKQGCFNKIKRPKIEVFADCFPNKISFGDVDGVVEINGYFLYLEWKPTTVISTGQRILIERRTLDGISVYLIVAGDAETMEVNQYAIARNGVISPWEIGTLEDIKQRMRDWAAMARTTERGYHAKQGSIA